MVDRGGERSKPTAAPGKGRDDVLTVSLFGGCAISLGGREVPVANRKGKAIIGYLAFAPGHRETRERLAGHFWGDLGEDKARMNLRQALKSLRDTFEAAGFKGFDTLYSDPGFLPGTVQFDVVDAIDSIAADWPVDALVDQPRLAETLLAGFEDADPSFRNLLLVKRESLSQKFARDLQDRMNAQPGTTAAAARLARALLRTDPTHEPAARMVMRWQADNGDMAGAITAYNHLCSQLDTVHDQLPDPETEKLIVAIKDGSYRPQLPQPSPSILAAIPASPLGFVSAPQASAARSPTPQEKLVLIIGRFEHVGERKELTFAFRHELSTRLAKFREWLLVDGEPPALPVSGNTPCYTLSAPLMEGDGAVNLMLSLKDSRSGAVVWGETFNIELENFFKSLQEVMRQIAAKLNVYISVERLNGIAAAPEVGTEIYDRWVLGQSLIYGWRPSDRRRLKQVLESIIRDAPKFSPAYSASAQRINGEHIVLPGVYRTIESQQASLKHASAAVALDPLDSRAQLALAWSNAFAGNFDAALIGFDNTCSLNEFDTWSVTSAALGYAFCDQREKARIAATRSSSMVLAPSPLHWCYQSNVSFVLGDYAASLAFADLCGDAVSNIPAWRTAALALTGRSAEASQEARRFIALIKALWHGTSEPTESAIVRWFLHCFPVRNPQVIDNLRTGLSSAGLKD